ncbi:MAG: hypothetical protein ABI432_11540 [Flavobacteriales bacterium]
MRNRIAWGNEDYFKEIDFPFDAMGAYLDAVAPFVAQRLELTKNKFESFAHEPANSLEWADDWFELWSAFETASLLLDLLYDSQLVSVYSFIERKLLFLCKELEKDQSIKLTDFNGKGIQKFRNYLSKVCSIDFAEVEHSWRELSHFGILRNILIHSEQPRLIPMKHKELLLLLEKSAGVILEEHEDGVQLRYKDSIIVKKLIGIGKTILRHPFYEHSPPAGADL